MSKKSTVKLLDERMKAATAKASESRSKAADAVKSAGATLSAIKGSQLIQHKKAK